VKQFGEKTWASCASILDGKDDLNQGGQWKHLCQGVHKKARQVIHPRTGKGCVRRVMLPQIVGKKTVDPGKVPTTTIKRPKSGS